MTARPLPAKAGTPYRGKLPVLLLLFMGFVAGGCKTSSPATVAELRDAGPFVRVLSISNTVQLQVASRKYLPKQKNGAAIWLTGACHIGEPGYYTQLQAHLEKQSLVLFEGISEKSDAARKDRHRTAKTIRPPEPPPARGPAAVGLQDAMASALGLEFQLSAIDYDQPNFRGCDLSITELRRIMAESSGPEGREASQSFDGLVQMMQGGSFFDVLLQAGLRLMTSTSKLQGMSKLAFIEMLEQMKGDPANLAGLPPSMKRLLEVIIQQRNQKVIADLRVDLRRRPPAQSVAVFYGVGHMPDLQERLRNELHYVPVRQEWFTAISVDLTASAVSPGEAAFIRGFVRSQLQLSEKPR
jgi:hypothetical protein